MPIFLEKNLSSEERRRDRLLLQVEFLAGIEAELTDLPVKNIAVIDGNVTIYTVDYFGVMITNYSTQRGIMKY